VIPPIDFEEKGIYLGFDPGTTHLGIAVLDTCSGNPECTLFQIDLKRSDDAVTRSDTTYRLLSLCVNWYCYPMYACIEGAAFSKAYRQAEMGEVRGAAIIWCKQHEFETRLGDPLVVRKEVFGNGRTKADQVWTNIPADAANALACAYFSMLMGE